MKKIPLSRKTACLLAAVLASLTPLASAQEQPANNMAVIHDTLKAEKRALVSKYMELTESEAKAFWPVYEQYQEDLEKQNQRLRELLQSYAADSQSLTDEKAQALLDRWLALEKDDLQRRRAYVPKVLRVLPPKKAARYLQIENEYRIVARYDLAVGVPLVQ